MRLDDFPTLKKNLSDRRANIIDQLLPQLSQARQAGEIANARYIDAKDFVGRAFEESWREVSKTFPSVYQRKNAGEFVNQKVVDFWYTFMYPQSHTMAGHIKKLQALPQDDPFVAAALPFLKEIYPIAEMMLALKTMTVKRVVKSEEEKQAEKYTPPKSSSRAVALVQSLLEKVVDDQFQELVDSITARHMKTLNDFVKALAASDQDPSLNGIDKWTKKPNDSYSLRHHFTYKSGPYSGKIDSVSLTLIDDVVSWGIRPTGKRGLIVNQNAPEVMETKARKQAKEIRDSFVVKNLKKIVSILERKGDDLFESAKTISRTVSLNSLEGSFSFTFKDGSYFEVTNSVVFSISSLGTPFVRFPLRFHNVKLAGGIPMKSPSEEAMNTRFLEK